MGVKEDTALITFHMPIEFRDKLDAKLKELNIRRTSLIMVLLNEWYSQQVERTDK